MKILKTLLMSLAASVFLFSVAFAGGGDAEKGKALFNDPKAFGGSTSCSSCHPDGKGLEKSGMEGKKDWKNPAGTFKSLEETINVCITMANKGKAIDTKSQEMKDVIAYIKSLGKEMKKAPGY
ncbi:MAG: c-type cytochrome [Nitrospirae bacterium]|nr:c-type cytochrome [Nitrospirota bacterium]